MKKIPARPETKKPRICWNKLKRPEIGVRHPRFFCFHTDCERFTFGSVVEAHPARE